MELIEYTERVVAFIDILGFSKLVYCSAECQCKRVELSTIVLEMQRVAEKIPEGIKDVTCVPIITCISDCFIISLPLEYGGNEVWGVLAMSQVISEVGQLLLRKGYLVSGGMDVGPVWHTQGNVIGPAYQNAYRLETLNTAPAVMLSDRVVKILQANGISDWGRFISRQEYYVNTLYGVPAPNLLGETEPQPNYRKTIMSIVSKKIDELDGAPQKKWVWFRDNVVNKRYPNASVAELDSVEKEPRSPELL